MKSCTVLVQFQYGAHSTKDRNSFQDHHTLHTSNDSKAGRFSTCTHTPNAKYFMDWTSSTGAHVHKLPKQVFKPGYSLALGKVQHPHNGRTSVNRLPLTKQDILSHYSGCFEGIEHFQRNHTNFI